MKSDVKAVRVTATGAVFAGRTRLRGLILVSDAGGSAGGLTLQDNTDSTTLFQADVANGDVFSFNIPEDGVVFSGWNESICNNKLNSCYVIDRQVGG